MIYAITSALALGFSFNSPMGAEQVMGRRAHITGVPPSLPRHSPPSLTVPLQGRP